MLRIDPNALADHLEVALTVARAATLAKLHEADSPCRRAATAELARHLADRLECFDRAFQEWQPVPGQPSLLAE